MKLYQPTDKTLALRRRRLMDAVAAQLDARQTADVKWWRETGKPALEALRDHYARNRRT